MRHAVALGADFVEIDVHLTRDKRVVVIHDNTLDRTTNGTGVVEAMDFAAIRAYDAGGGETVPEFAEALDVVTGSARLLCELKSVEVAEAAVRIAREREVLDRVTFISFQIPALWAARAQGADVKLGYLLFNPSEADIVTADELKAESIDMDYRRVCYHVVRAVQGAGLLLRCWTPNLPEEFEALTRLGVDSITTDRPDLLLERLGRLAATDTTV